MNRTYRHTKYVIDRKIRHHTLAQPYSTGTCRSKQKDARIKSARTSMKRTEKLAAATFKIRQQIHKNSKELYLY